jgi:hypothetical protein
MLTSHDHWQILQDGYRELLSWLPPMLGPWPLRYRDRNLSVLPPPPSPFPYCPHHSSSLTPVVALARKDGPVGIALSESAQQVSPGLRTPRRTMSATTSTPSAPIWASATKPPGPANASPLSMARPANTWPVVADWTPLAMVTGGVCQ